MHQETYPHHTVACDTSYSALSNYEPICVCARISPSDLQLHHLSLPLSLSTFYQQSTCNTIMLVTMYLHMFWSRGVCGWFLCEYVCNKLLWYWNWNKVPSQHCAHCRLQTMYSWNWSGWVSFNCQERDNRGATEVWAILITYRWTEKHGETIFVAETIKSKMNVTVMLIPLICFCHSNLIPCARGRVSL